MTDPIIALVTHRWMPSRPSGVARAVVGTARAIGSLDQNARPGRYVAASLAEPTTPSLGLPYQRLPWPRQPVQLAWAAFHRPRIDRPLGHPALVHLLHPWAPVPSRAPLVATVHDLFPLTRPRWLPGLPGRLHRAGLRFAARHSQLLVANSRATASALHDILDVETERIAVVPWGIDDRFRQPVADDEIERVCHDRHLPRGEYVVTVGEINERKNGRVLLEALARLPPLAAGGVELVVVGAAGAGADRFWSGAAELHVESRIRGVGWIDDAELRRLVAGAAALVHPSLDEGFGFTPLEAMASGVPAVVANSGALPETVGNGAVVADPHDVDAWAEAIARLRNDADYRADFVTQGRNRAATFTWRRTAELLVEVHDRVLKGK